MLIYSFLIFPNINICLRLIRSGAKQNLEEYDSCLSPSHTVDPPLLLSYHPDLMLLLPVLPCFFPGYSLSWNIPPTLHLNLFRHHFCRRLSSPFFHFSMDQSLFPANSCDFLHYLPAALYIFRENSYVVIILCIFELER